jgi:hypothetical protein
MAGASQQGFEHTFLPKENRHHSSALRAIVSLLHKQRPDEHKKGSIPLFRDALAKARDVVIRPWFLIGELVARETDQN